MAKISIADIKQELVFFLRNSDVLTITERGVTTATATGTFSSDTTLTISRANIKNIRSVTVGGSGLTYGTDYTVNTQYNSNTQCRITFTEAQTGDYSIPYDYGTDKIWPDFPRDDLDISSFPRIAIEIISLDSDAFGFGNDNITSVLFTIVVYSKKVTEIDAVLDAVRVAFIDSHKSFTYLTKITPQPTGPLIKSSNKSQQILQRNLDFISRHNVEIN